MTGLKRRTGEVVRRDKAISIGVLIACLEVLDSLWLKAGCAEEKLWCSRMGLWYTLGFSIGLRGEEMLIIERAATLRSLVYLEPNRHETPHLRAVMNGATKGRREMGATVSIPCAGESQRSKIPTGKWASRYKDSLDEMGELPGFLFGTNANPTPRLSDFEDDFFVVLERVQDQRPGLIGPEVDVRDEYGIWRSLRRGATAHAINVGIPDKLVELVNRWRAELDRRSGLPMIDVYSDYEALLPTTIKYSLYF